jgi:hypothetical protein
MLAVLFSVALSNVAPAAPADLQALDAARTFVTVECDVAQQALNGCRVIGEASDAQSAEALKLAATMQLPAALAQAGVRHVRLRLQLDDDAPAGSPTPR